MTRLRHRSVRLLVLFALFGGAVLLVARATAEPTSTTSAPTTTAVATQLAARTPAEAYGLWATAPAVVAIVLAIATRQVVVSLGIAVLVAAWMYVPWARPDASLFNPIPPITQAVNGYLIHAALADAEHIHILLFTLMIGGMVGIVSANGGMRALVNKASRFASTPERGQMVGWLGGLAVFFDDYSNAMVVGPTMRPMTDRLKVSREKLAYIVDSTAAPVASLMIGTWFGAEISYIQSGLDMLRDSGTAPAFLLDSNGDLVSGMRAYFLSWPHRFYPILAIVMVFLVAWRGRDFGPMLTAERKARAGAPPNAPLKSTAFEAGSAEVEGRAWYAVVPMLVLVGVSLALLVILGWGGSDAATWASAGWADRVRIITDNTDSYASILYAALASLVVAGAIAALTRAIPLHVIHDAMMNGMTRIFPALVILALAWSLAAGMDDLQLAQVAETFLKEQQFHVQLLPLLVFLISAGVSFATGSSWSTMIIICPIVVKVGAGLADGLEPEFARRIFYSAVGSVLAGSIFGDHCSPISDTTVLSSMGSDCDHVAHVWTQMPYAVAVAIVGTVCGDLLCTEMNWNPLIGIGLSIVVLLVVLQVVGRRVGGQTAT